MSPGRARPYASGRCLVKSTSLEFSSGVKLAQRLGTDAFRGAKRQEGLQQVDHRIVYVILYDVLPSSLMKRKLEEKERIIGVIYLRTRKATIDGCHSCKCSQS